MGSKGSEVAGKESNRVGVNPASPFLLPHHPYRCRIN